MHAAVCTRPRFIEFANPVHGDGVRPQTMITDEPSHVHIARPSQADEPSHIHIPRRSRSMRLTAEAAPLKRSAHRESAHAGYLERRNQAGELGRRLELEGARCPTGGA